MRTRKLRFHHLMCMPLFAGNGYSDEFSANMWKIKSILENEDLILTLVSSCDDICENCPNREGGFCITKGEINERVIGKDRKISEIIGLGENAETNYYGGLRAAFERISEEKFNELCGKCSWKEFGLCSYSQWKNAVLKYIKI